MKREFYLELAENGLQMPIATDLVLHEQPNPEDVILDSEALGRVIAETAHRFQTPLAFPLMDLELEKDHLLSLIDVSPAERPTYHFTQPLDAKTLQVIEERLAEPLSPRMQTVCGALDYVARNTDKVPVGMCIGPFSLMTKLIADPITPIAMAGMGLRADDDDAIRTMEQALAVGLQMILRYVKAQVEAGAKAIMVCEPAANTVYLSPRQIEKGSDIFDRYVMAPNLALKELLAAHGAELIFHDCGELTDEMVRRFAELEPVILSLGSSRDLPHDAGLLPGNIVLFGNLPSKRFYSDSEITVGEVRQQAETLAAAMAATGHPFILGTECDVLSVPGAKEIIMEKALAIQTPELQLEMEPVFSCRTGG